MKINKNVEKIRDDLYVKKGIGGTYEVVYPPKDFEGNKIPGNFKKLFLSDLKSSIWLLITVGVLLLILLPGSYQLKEECEDTINYLIEESCMVCASSQSGNYGGVKDSLNLTVLEIGEDNV